MLTHKRLFVSFVPTQSAPTISMFIQCSSPPPPLRRHRHLLVCFEAVSKSHRISELAASFVGEWSLIVAGPSLTDSPSHPSIEPLVIPSLCAFPTIAPRTSTHQAVIQISNTPTLLYSKPLLSRLPSLATPSSRCVFVRLAGTLPFLCHALSLDSLFLSSRMQIHLARISVGPCQHTLPAATRVSSIHSFKPSPPLFKLI
ncbi:hypothetical protein C8R43DRAFT_1047625 [Mycena crocata]|nr:hypothetical protein C8R43DRAFT_1047625 [Mycena crocata]